MRLLLCSLFFLPACSPTPADEAVQGSGGVVLYEGARLIIGDGSPPVAESAFVVEDGRFMQVGRRGEVEPPEGAARVDLTGKTVIPGMIDAHTHIGYQDYRDMTAAEMSSPESYSRENILDHLTRAGYFGVVAVMSMGYDHGDVPFEVRDETLAGQHPNAARFLTAGRGLATPDSLRPSNGRQDAYGVTTVADAREAIQELAARDVEMVKLWVSGPRPGGAARFSSKVPMAPEVYRAVIEEAHAQGMRVVVDSWPQDAKELVRAGVDGFAHTPTADDELLGLLEERGENFFIMTTFGRPDPDWQAGPPPQLQGLFAPPLFQRFQEGYAAARAEQTPEALEEEREEIEERRRNVQNLRATGVKMTFASDAGGIDVSGARDLVGWGAHAQLEGMVWMGFTPAEAITSATKTAAEVLQLNDLGGVASGKSADFIVLNANPLDDIKNTRQIDAVYMRGRQVDREALRAEWNR